MVNLKEKEEEEVKSLFIHISLFRTHSGYFLLHTLLFDLIYVMAELRISITGNCNDGTRRESFRSKSIFRYIVRQNHDLQKYAKQRKQQQQPQHRHHHNI